MAASVRTVTRSDLEHRREEILKRLGATLAKFNDIMSTLTLTGEELDAAEELEQIGFLLGEDPTDLTD